jgi:tetratricopeptide (TPR) repeat protein
VEALLCHGIISMANEQYEEARVFLDHAFKVNPNSNLCITALSMFYSKIGQEQESEKYIEMIPKGVQTHFIELAEFCSNANFLQLAQEALAQDFILNGAHVQPYVLLSKLEVQRGDYKQALEHLLSALKLEMSNHIVWANIGHLKFKQRLFNDAKSAYENALSNGNSILQGDSSNLVYLRMGYLYLDQAYEQSSADPVDEEDADVDASLAMISKEMYLRACKSSSTCESWLGVGRACLALKQYDEAEEALAVTSNDTGSKFAQQQKQQSMGAFGTGMPDQREND